MLHTFKTAMMPNTHTKKKHYYILCSGDQLGFGCRYDDNDAGSAQALGSQEIVSLFVLGLLSDEHDLFCSLQGLLSVGTIKKDSRRRSAHNQPY